MTVVYDDSVPMITGEVAKKFIDQVGTPKPIQVTEQQFAMYKEMMDKPSYEELEAKIAKYEEFMEECGLWDAKQEYENGDYE